MHVAVTGASSGIGEAIAREFAKAGAKVTVVARRRERLEALAKELGAGVVHVAAQDLSDPEKACDWVAGAEAVHGPIDVLVNNAGVELIARMAESPVAEAERLLRLNLLVPLRITRNLLPGMIARGRGTIVDVASVAALAPPRGYTYYAASKAGLAAASEALRGELDGTGVHVVTVYPGPVQSEMADSALAALEPSPWIDRAPWGTCAGLASLVRRAVEKKKARVIYPRLYTAARLFPALARWVTDKTAPWPKRKPAPEAVPVAPT